MTHVAFVNTQWAYLLPPPEGVAGLGFVGFCGASNLLGNDGTRERKKERKKGRKKERKREKKEGKKEGKKEREKKWKKKSREKERATCQQDGKRENMGPARAEVEDREGGREEGRKGGGGSKHPVDGGLGGSMEQLKKRRGKGG